MGLFRSNHFTFPAVWKQQIKLFLVSRVAAFINWHTVTFAVHLLSRWQHVGYINSDIQPAAYKLQTFFSDQLLSALSLSCSPTHTLCKVHNLCVFCGCLLHQVKEMRFFFLAQAAGNNASPPINVSRLQTEYLPNAFILKQRHNVNKRFWHPGLFSHVDNVDGKVNTEKYNMLLYW